MEARWHTHTDSGPLIKATQRVSRFDCFQVRLAVKFTFAHSQTQPCHRSDERREITICQAALICSQSVFTYLPLVVFLFANKSWSFQTNVHLVRSARLRSGNVNLNQFYSVSRWGEIHSSRLAELSTESCVDHSCLAWAGPLYIDY